MSDIKAKMHQIRFRLGLCPRPRWGSLQRSPDPVAGGEGLAAPSSSTLPPSGLDSLHEICLVASHENNYNWCHQMSDFKAKCTKFDCVWGSAQTPLGELTALPRPPSWWGGANCPLLKNPPPIWALRASPLLSVPGTFSQILAPGLKYVGLHEPAESSNRRGTASFRCRPTRRSQAHCAVA